VARNIAYVEHTTFGKAIAAHLRHLRKMGRPDAVEDEVCAVEDAASEPPVLNPV
jgi:hypothetical protein